MMEKKELISKCYKRVLSVGNTEYVCITDVNIENKQVDILQMYTDASKKRMTTYGIATVRDVDLNVLTDSGIFTEIPKTEFDNKWQEANLRLEQAYINRQRKLFV